MLSPRERIDAIVLDIEFLAKIGTPVSQAELLRCQAEIDDCWALMAAGLHPDARVMVLPGGLA